MLLSTLGAWWGDRKAKPKGGGARVIELEARLDELETQFVSLAETVRHDRRRARFRAMRDIDEQVKTALDETSKPAEALAQASPLAHKLNLYRKVRGV